MQTRVLMLPVRLWALRYLRTTTSRTTRGIHQLHNQVIFTKKKTTSNSNQFCSMPLLLFFTWVSIVVLVVSTVSKRSCTKCMQLEIVLDSLLLLFSARQSIDYTVIMAQFYEDLLNSGFSHYFFICLVVTLQVCHCHLWQYHHYYDQWLWILLNCDYSS